jgi:hypothetical protein
MYRLVVTIVCISGKYRSCREETRSAPQRARPRRAATGGWALPERDNSHRVSKAHHRPIRYFAGCGKWVKIELEGPLNQNFQKGSGADLSGYARASLRLRTATQALTGEAEIPHCSTSAIQRFRSVMSLCMLAQKRAADTFIAQECHLLSHAASLPATVERFRVQLCRPLCGQGLRRRNDLNTVAPMPTWWKGLS